MEIGVYASNCYIIYDEGSKEGIVVDPGGNPRQILENIQENEISVKYIVLTHGHGDHIGGVRELKEALNLHLIAHEAEEELIGDASQNISHMMVTGAIELDTDITVKDGDTIDFGNLSARVIHTPGHTKGGMCLHIG